MVNSHTWIDLDGIAHTVSRDSVLGAYEREILDLSEEIENIRKALEKILLSAARGPVSTLVRTPDIEAAATLLGVSL